MLADLFFYSRNPQFQSHDVVKRNKMWKIKTFTIIFVIIILICNQMQLFQFFVLFSCMAVLAKNKKKTFSEMYYSIKTNRHLLLDNSGLLIRDESKSFQFSRKDLQYFLNLLK